ncbi:hypothetical protein E4T43_03694 [Aureobasidium subglaciale]|nr:hypothetical protein E4T43_03694 [Aureobasidium subglaciale]
MGDKFVYPDPQEMSWPYHIHYLYNPNLTAPTHDDYQHLAREELSPVTFVAPDDSQSWVGVRSQYWPLSFASQGTNTIAATFEANPTAQQKGQNWLREGTQQRRPMSSMHQAWKPLRTRLPQNLRPTR